MLIAYSGDDVNPVDPRSMWRVPRHSLFLARADPVSRGLLAVEYFIAVLGVTARVASVFLAMVYGAARHFWRGWPSPSPHIISGDAAAGNLTALSSDSRSMLARYGVDGRRNDDPDEPLKILLLLRCYVS